MPLPSQAMRLSILAALLAFGGSLALAETAAAPTDPAAAKEPAADSAATVTAEVSALPAPVSPETVVATVNGTRITLGHMLMLRRQLPQQYQTLPDDVLFTGILDQLIQQTALMQSVEDDISPRDAIAIENDRRAYLAGAAIDAASAIAITEEALQQLYDETYAQAEPTREFHAAHILVKTEEEARKLKADIDGGADFAEVAKAHSTDGAAASGGDLGWFGRGQMVKEFEDAVAAMETGDVSDPVQTQFGWHLIKLAETRSVEAPALDAVREDLTGELRKRAVETRIRDLTAAAKIDRTEAGIDPSVLSDQTMLAK